MNISKKVYICSPYRGRNETEIGGNVGNAIKYCRYAVKQGVFPIAPHLYLTRFLDDNNPAERTLGLELGLVLLRACSEVWILGERISEGMRGEIAEAKRLGIKTINIQI
ncbi:hypothetical protein FACS1894202_09430 [Clostridia bacterium]|nr:hypothetical protein FACS1894202_09430 [Clostridia bacterium]